MVNIVLVDKGGTIKNVKMKENIRNNLYKKCGIRNNKDFYCQAKWTVTLSGEKYRIELWGRTQGKANTENKYDFPPPADNSLFFGTCCLVRVNIDTDVLIDLPQESWDRIYEKLFGGFEDIEAEEEESEDELASIPKNMKTKTGYLKDSFVVDEEDNDETEEDEEDEEESIVEDNNEDMSDDDYDDEYDSNDVEENESGDDLQIEPYCYSDDD